MGFLKDNRCFFAKLVLNGITLKLDMQWEVDLSAKYTLLILLTKTIVFGGMWC